MCRISGFNCLNNVLVDVLYDDCHRRWEIEDNNIWTKFFFFFLSLLICSDFMCLLNVFSCCVGFCFRCLLCLL